MKRFICIILMGLILNGCGEDDSSFMFETSEGIEIKEITDTDETASFTVQNVMDDESIEELVYVHVCGEVVNPGVYALPAGSRAYEALDAAGGPTDMAAVYLVNLAETVFDAEKLYIPGIGETLPENKESVSAEAVQGKVNINTATKEQLMTLNGIGEAKADAIIAYRNSIGSFTSAEQIMEVNGIKQSAYEKIKNDIIV